MTTDRRYYISVETDFFTHPKVSAIGRDLAFKHLAAIAWCHQHLTDGFVPEASLGDLHITKREVAKLVKSDGDGKRLWEPAAGGWRIHDYLKHQPSRSEMRKRSEVGKRAAGVRWASETHAEANASGNAERMPDASETHAERNALTNGLPNGSPMPSYSKSYSKKQTSSLSDSSRSPRTARDDEETDRKSDRGRRGELRAVGPIAAELVATARAGG